MTDQCTKRHPPMWKRSASRELAWDSPTSRCDLNAGHDGQHSRTIDADGVTQTGTIEYRWSGDHKSRYDELTAMQQNAIDRLIYAAIASPHTEEVAWDIDDAVRQVHRRSGADDD